MDKDKITHLKSLIDLSRNTLFFGGAGVSTESGIPDFRGCGGIYEKKFQGIPPETIVSARFYKTYPELFFEFYKKYMLYPQAKPNSAHYALAKLEQMGKLECVITQNIDGLHEAAGSKDVIDLHGSSLRNYCESCGKKYPLEYIINSDCVPKCSCGGTVRPDVVLYDEGLDGEKLTRAFELSQSADLLIVGGTSLNVYPASGVVQYFRGKDLVIINKSPTPYDKFATLLIKESIGETFAQLMQRYTK